MMINGLTKKGFSTIEYMVVVTIVVGTMFVFKDYIIRGITGRWKSFSDQVGHGRQFHPIDTVECAFDQEFGKGWYDVTCVDNKNCPFGNQQCKEAAITACAGTAYCR